MKNTSGTVEVLLLNVAQAAKALGLGRTKVYELIQSRELSTVRVGRAIRLRPETLRAWVERQEQQSMA